MPELVYKRRTKYDATDMGEAFSSSEVSDYFKSQEEWKLASEIFWDREATNIYVLDVLRKYKITITVYQKLMQQYRLFMAHKYEVKE